MARVPTWTELRLDAIKLAKTQKECYRSAHLLLDSALPELDRKIMLVNGKKTLTQRTIKFEQHGPHLPQPDHSGDNYDQNKTLHFPEYQNQLDLLFMKCEELNRLQQERQLQQQHHQHEQKHDHHQYEQEHDHHQHEQEHDHHQHEQKHDHHQLEQKRSVEQDFKYLRPPPMPLSHYFERTRIFKLVERRDKYLKKKRTERRRYLANKLIKSLKRIKLSSEKNANTLNNNIHTNHKRAIRNHYDTPEHRVKLSEQEMKRLTAKTYERLPEVKERRREEAKRHTKVQNYINKIKFNRKLLENRRQGIIDYPLSSINRRLAYDDRSITSSQSDFSINEYAGAADPLRSDPYY